VKRRLVIGRLGDYVESGTKSIRPHYRLDAWKEAMALVKQVYLLTGEFPVSEAYGLTAQMRRSAVSIPSNLAEGAARAGTKEFAQLLNIAKGSLSELETQVLIAKDLGYTGDIEGVLSQAERVSRLLAGLHKKVLAG
jgi:four helix bundle protein